MGSQAITALQVFTALRAVLGPPPKRPGLQDVWTAPSCLVLVVFQLRAHVLAPWLRHTAAVIAVASVSWRLWGRVSSLSPPRTLAVCPNLAAISASSNPGTAMGRGFLLSGEIHAG